jgi:hypothetical protein
LSQRSVIRSATAGDYPMMLTGVRVLVGGDDDRGEHLIDAAWRRSFCCIASVLMLAAFWNDGVGVVGHSPVLLL